MGLQEPLQWLLVWGGAVADAHAGIQQVPYKAAHQQIGPQAAAMRCRRPPHSARSEGISAAWVASQGAPCKPRKDG